MGLTWQDVETVYTLIYGWGGGGRRGGEVYIKICLGNWLCNLDVIHGHISSHMDIYPWKLPVRGSSHACVCVWERGWGWGSFSAYIHLL